MKKAFLSLFREFRFARKRLGGTWYRVTDNFSAGGFEGPMSHWTQHPCADDIILSTEQY